MATRTVLGFVLSVFVLLSLVLTPLNSGFAQDTKGRWVFGVHAGFSFGADCEPISRGCVRAWVAFTSTAATRV